MKLFLTFFILLIYNNLCAQTVIWENTFSDPNDWTIGNSGTVDIEWQIGTGLQTSGGVPIAAINSETYSDGCALMDSDAYANSSGIENSWFQTLNPIDLSEFTNIQIEFANQYLMWDGGSSDGIEYCLLEISTDGVNWPSVDTYEVSEAAPGSRFELWPNMETQDPVNNPTIKLFNISELCAGEETIYLRFRWVGDYGYAWFVDDIKISEMFENDLAIVPSSADNIPLVSDLNNFRLIPIIDEDGTPTEGFEYFSYPESQRPTLQASTSIINYGANDAEGVTLSGTINGINYSSEPLTLLSGETADAVSIGSWDTEEFPSGTYNIDMGVTSEVVDQNIINNSISEQIRLDSYIMARDNGILQDNFISGGGETEIYSAGALYEIFGEGTIYSINVVLTESTVLGEEVSVTLRDFNTDDFEIIEYSSPIIIEEDHLNQLNSTDVFWLSIPLSQPVEVNPGDVVLPMLSYQGGAGVQVGKAQTNAPDLSCFIYVDFGELGESWYFSSNVPMVRLNFNPNNPCEDDELAGCDDLTACNYNPLAVCNDGSCDYIIEGCSDPSACNYNPSACNDSDGYCCYGICGCSDPNSLNFTEDLDCEIECQYLITGTVFHDMNENGTQDEGEVGLANQEVTISPEGLVLLTNDLGQLSFEIGEGEQVIEVTTSESFPFPTTDNPITLNTSELETTEFNFGFTSTVLSYELDVNLYPNGNGFLCNADFEYNIAFTNQGNAAINGVVELAYDSLFQGFNPITPTDSSATDTVYMSFENLLPGQTEIFSIDLITPLVDFIGEQVTHHVNIYGYYLDEQVSFGTDSLNMEIACAYDPNDKQAFPLGYTDEHWLLPETEQEFLVRFQNTGNALAQDVRIQDTIDVNYDLETFRLVANSHSVMTTINQETRVVEFFFEGIQLPDSVNNEPESHGLVSYAITSYTDLAVGTELNNTAYIYFDNNEPIITNTTWNTIHECGGEAAFEASASEICIDETVQFTSTYPALENYSWSVNDETEGSEDSFSRIFTEAGTYEIQFIGENPICSETSSQTITVYQTPTVTISQNGDLLNSSEGNSYQWFLNGEAIEGATAQEYTVTEDGTYTVEVTNGGLCTGTSEGVMVVNIAELEAETILLYPNPMMDRAFLEFEDASTRTVRLIDSTGKEVKVWESIATQKIEITRDELAAGNYVVSIEKGSSSRNIQLIIR